MNELRPAGARPGDQAVLLGQAAEALASRHPGAVMVELPTGAKARMYCRPVRGDGRLAGGVVHVKLVAGRCRDRPAGRGAAGPDGPARPGRLRARSGCAACHQVETVYRLRRVAGPRGRAAASASSPCSARCTSAGNPAGRFHVLDAAEAADPDWPATPRRSCSTRPGSAGASGTSTGSTARRLHALAAALQEARPPTGSERCGSRSPWATASAAQGRGQAAAVLPQHGGAAAAAAPHRGPARAGAVLARQAQPRRPR